MNVNSGKKYQWRDNFKWYVEEKSKYFLKQNISHAKLWKMYIHSPKITYHHIKHKWKVNIHVELHNKKYETFRKIEKKNQKPKISNENHIKH